MYIALREWLRAGRHDFPGFADQTEGGVGDHAHERVLARDARDELVVRHEVDAVTAEPIELADRFERRDD